MIGNLLSRVCMEEVKVSCVLLLVTCSKANIKRPHAGTPHSPEPRASRIMWRGNWGLVLPSLRSYQLSFPFT